MTSIKNNELFEIADILKKNGFETSSLHSNYDIKHLYSTNDLRNNLTNRKLGIDINFFKKKNKKYITRQMHQDKNGSSWMKIDFLTKELMEWQRQLKQDIAILFISGKHFSNVEVLDYCQKLERELRNKGKIIIINKVGLSKLLEEKKL
jgi:hypothetical protein